MTDTAAASPLRGVTAAARSLGCRRRRRACSTLEELALPLEPARAPTARSRTSAAATPPRKARRSTTPAARCGRSGSRAPAPTWRRSRAPASPRSASTRFCRCARARRWPTPRWSTTSAAAACRPTSRARRSRRCCTRSCRPPQVDHTHPDAIIALTSSPDGRALAESAFGDEAVWLDYQRPGFAMSRRIAELLEENPARARRPAREARARHLGRDRRGVIPRHDRVRHARSRGDRRRGEERLRARRPARPRGRRRRGATTCSPRRCLSLRGAARGRRHCPRPGGRPQPRGGRVRVRGPHARGQPGRRTLPRPPDQHEAQAARRRLRPGPRRRRRARRRRSRAGWTSTAPGTASTTSATSTTRRRPFPQDPAGPRVVAGARASASSRAAPTRAARASRATFTTARSWSRTRPMRSAASRR